MTKVAFKVEKNPYTGKNEVFAFFPMEKDRHDGENYTSYSHNGQHSLCAKTGGVGRTSTSMWTSTLSWSESATGT